MKRRPDVDVLPQLARSARIEVIPLRGVQDKLAVVPRNTTVTVTCSLKFGLERTLEHTRLAVESGHRVVPHLAARQVADERELRAFVGRLGRLGVDELYVIGGDAPEPVGEYSSAAELLETLARIEHGITRIGVACYPEGHPKIGDADLLDALRRKQPYADYMVSQLCFDAGALVSWLQATRAAGIELPLYLGLAAPLNSRKLMELSLKIGVGSSLRYLSKQHGVLGNLLWGRTYQPERLLLAMEDELAAGELGIEGLHLFSFNQLDATVDWQQNIAGEAGTYRTIQPGA